MLDPEAEAQPLGLSPYHVVKLVSKQRDGQHRDAVVHRLQQAVLTPVGDEDTHSGVTLEGGRKTLHFIHSCQTSSFFIYPCCLNQTEITLDFIGFHWISSMVLFLIVCLLFYSMLQIAVLIDLKGFPFHFSILY